MSMAYVVMLLAIIYVGGTILYALKTGRMPYGRDYLFRTLYAERSVSPIRYWLWLSIFVFFLCSVIIWFLATP